jgi:hypothetical protein
MRKFSNLKNYSYVEWRNFFARMSKLGFSALYASVVVVHPTGLETLAAAWSRAKFEQITVGQSVSTRRNRLKRFCTIHSALDCVLHFQVVTDGSCQSVDGELQQLWSSSMWATWMFLL